MFGDNSVNSGSHLLSGGFGGRGLGAENDIIKSDAVE